MAVFKRIKLSGVDFPIDESEFPVKDFISIGFISIILSITIGSFIYQMSPFFQKLYLDLVSISLL